MPNKIRKHINISNRQKSLCNYAKICKIKLKISDFTSYAKRIYNLVCTTKVKN